MCLCVLLFKKIYYYDFIFQVVSSLVSTMVMQTSLNGLVTTMIKHAGNIDVI